jgi:hypothetical protein
MTKIFTVAAMLLLLLTGQAAAAPRARSADTIEQVWAAFQAAVQANEKEQVASLMRFPLDGWDENDVGTQITKADFMKNYARMFTPNVKRGIAAGKPVKQEDGSYAVIWHGARNAKYTLGFENVEGQGYRCTFLAIGD